MSPAGGPAWFGAAIAEFGIACKAKLNGPGDPEAAIRSPIESFLGVVADHLRLEVTAYDEVSDPERGVRPDYAIRVGGAISGYIEVKRPGASIDPDNFRGHNLRQWQRQRDLPNLIYTNGTEWRLWRDFELVGDPVCTSGGPLHAAGAGLAAGEELLGLLTDFLRWEPVPITSVGALVNAISPLTRLLRGEVVDQLKAEHRLLSADADTDLADVGFIGLASDWKNLLFPTASDEVFADGYAQAVTFALLLARTEGIALDKPLHEIGVALGGKHSLMGKALQILTDDVRSSFVVTLDLLVRVVGAVDWKRVRAGRRDTYLHLYEHFLDVYDPELRKQSGSYYTPFQVVDEMTRFTEEALIDHLGLEKGFRDPSVLTVDPAMGTGTYLQTIIDRAAMAEAEQEGDGMKGPMAASLANRLVGFELQMGPYAVSELRTTELLVGLDAAVPADGLHLYVTNTLDNPHLAVTQLGSGLEPIAHSRREANKIKASDQVTVVIGNPPYRERAEGLGGWIEAGDPGSNTVPPLDAFRADGNGLSEYVLKNFYVYFWRWATMKVFDDSLTRSGVVCFITTAGYVRGPGFKGMREYLRRNATAGWIIDLSPEGIRPEVATRVFPGVQQPLAIGLFVRRPDNDPGMPAVISHRAVHGHRDEKYATLAKISLGDDGWRAARSAWQAPFTPASEGAWDDYPALNDLFPWVAPGVKPNRTWVYSPARESLVTRWQRLVAENDPTEKSRLFRESRDANLAKMKGPLLGTGTQQFTTPFCLETERQPKVVRVGYRSFDRQWIIADSRLLHGPSPDLWEARIPGQVFMIEQHAEPIDSGPGVVFTNLIPDMHHFNNRGGRALPLLHPDGAPNIAPGLLAAVEQVIGVPVDAEDVVSYVAGVAAHRGFTARFADELTTPGVRVPISADPALWEEAIELGRTVVWLHTYGEAMSTSNGGRPLGDIRLHDSDSQRILNRVAVTEMPETIELNDEKREVHAGTGTWGPVTGQVFDYDVGGRTVVKSWFDYRRRDPAGKRTSPLDDMHIDAWPIDWSRELTDLLTVLTRLVDLEPLQADLLDRILAGPLASADELTQRGVRWPTAKKDRRPRHRPLDGPVEGTLDLGN